ncbi:hypothetical protein [Streptomyces sp. NRRL S-146]|uniref:hypothetical protein n=1 Tax=Streptomyces sp. NRRL S-146 TaxID=1463884 RepID=UPI00055BB95E|nr:hypothetical protein [Streptomyces sp. NRRL S-146]
MHAPLPTHPLTGALALGWRKARPGEDDELHPIWPILGAADDEDEENQDDEGTGDDDQDDDSGAGDDEGGDGDDEDDDADPEGADQLGDPGKKALARMKEKLKAERTRRRQAEERANQGASDDAVAKATAAATATANTRIIKAEIRAAAAKKLADPRDALRFLDLEQFEVDADGEVDADEIADAIEELIKNKPYLAAATGRRFQGSGDGGAQRKAGRPKQLTQSDLKKMTPDQIVKAQNDGRLEDLLGSG